MARQPHIESPCTSVCAIDQVSGYCLGCWRSTDEIAEWGSSDNERKLAILGNLHKRREQNGGRPRRVSARRGSR